MTAALIVWVVRVGRVAAFVGFAGLVPLLDPALQVVDDVAEEEPEHESDQHRLTSGSGDVTALEDSRQHAEAEVETHDPEGEQTPVDHRLTKASHDVPHNIAVRCVHTAGIPI